MSRQQPDRPWFRATKTHSNFRAVPITWEGWATVIGFIGGAIIIGIAMQRALMAYAGPWAVLIYLPFLGLAAWAFYRFVESKSDITDLRG